MADYSDLGFKPITPGGAIKVNPHADLGFTPSGAPAPRPEPQQSPLSKLGSAFWEGIGGQAVMDIMGGASRHPEHAKKARETARGIIEGLAKEPARVWDELGKTGDAMIHGDIPGTAEHLAGSAPLVGAPALQVEHDFQNGDYSKGFGHAIALLLPFAAKPGAQAIGDAANAAKSGAKAAVRGGIEAVENVAANPTLRDIGTVVAPEMPKRLKAAGRLLDRLPDSVKDSARSLVAKEEIPAGSLPPAEAARRAELSRLADFDRAQMIERMREQIRNEAAAAPPIPPEPSIIPLQTPPEAPILSPQPSQIQPQPGFRRNGESWLSSVPLRNTPGLSSASLMESGVIVPDLLDFGQQAQTASPRPQLTHNAPPSVRRIPMPISEEPPPPGGPSPSPSVKGDPQTIAAELKAAMIESGSLPSEPIPIPGPEFAPEVHQAVARGKKVPMEEAIAESIHKNELTRHEVGDLPLKWWHKLGESVASETGIPKINISADTIKRILMRMGELEKKAGKAAPAPEKLAKSAAASALEPKIESHPKGSMDSATAELAAEMEKSGTLQPPKPKTTRRKR